MSGLRSTFAVLEPASNLSLLSAEERRTAVGLAANDASQDTILEAIELRVVAAIAAECNVAEADAGSGVEPTLKRERIEQTVDLYEAANFIPLARRHKIQINSITAGGEVVDESEFRVKSAAGLLYRVGVRPFHVWTAPATIVIDYWAGFDTIPADLKMAAMDFMRVVWLERDRDPALKSENEDIEGIRRIERTYWVGSVPGTTGEGAVPDIVAGQLLRFKAPAFA